MLYKAFVKRTYDYQVLIHIFTVKFTFLLYTSTDIDLHCKCKVCSKLYNLDVNLHVNLPI